MRRPVTDSRSAVGYLSRLLADRTRAMSVDLVTAQANAVVHSNDPYALSLTTNEPGKVIVLNVGISQIHFGIYDTEESGADVHGIIDHADQQVTRITVSVGPHQKSIDHAPFKLSDLFTVMQEVTALLGEAFTFHPEDVTAIGHRVVHGGNKFSSSVVITSSVIADIEELSVFAPLHNPVNVAGIRVAMKHFPNIPQVAVFDTAFHQTLAPYAYLYGLPYELYKQHGIRRYGFHGTSHRYVSLKSAEETNRQRCLHLPDSLFIGIHRETPNGKSQHSKAQRPNDKTDHQRPHRPDHGQCELYAGHASVASFPAKNGTKNYFLYFRFVPSSENWSRKVSFEN